jgi:hypothetical protein
MTSSELQRFLFHSLAPLLFLRTLGADAFESTTKKQNSELKTKDEVQDSEIRNLIEVVEIPSKRANAIEVEDRMTGVSNLTLVGDSEKKTLGDSALVSMLSILFSRLTTEFEFEEVRKICVELCARFELSLVLPKVLEKLNLLLLSTREMSLFFDGESKDVISRDGEKENEKLISALVQQQASHLKALVILLCNITVRRGGKKLENESVCFPAIARGILRIMALPSVFAFIHTGFVCLFVCSIVRLSFFFYVLFHYYFLFKL